MVSEGRGAELKSVVCRWQYRDRRRAFQVFVSHPRRSVSAVFCRASRFFGSERIPQSVGILVKHIHTSKSIFRFQKALSGVKKLF